VRWLGRHYSRQNGNLYIYVTGGDPMLDLKLFPPELSLFESESAWRIHDRAAIAYDVEKDSLDRAGMILHLNGFRRRDIQEELLERYYALGDEAVLGRETSPGIIRPPSPRRMPEIELAEEVIMPEVAMPKVFRPEAEALTLPLLRGGLRELGAAEERPLEDQAGRGSTETLELHEDPHDMGEASEERLKEMEPALPEMLQSIREGAQLLAESRAEDARLVGELCASLTAYTGWLGVTLELPPDTIPKLDDAAKISLTPQGHLVIVDRQGKVHSKALGDYPTEIVLIVVLNTLPQLRSVINRHAQRLGERIKIFEMINRELRRLPTSAEETLREEA